MFQAEGMTGKEGVVFDSSRFNPFPYWKGDKKERLNQTGRARSPRKSDLTLVGNIYSIA